MRPNLLEGRTALVTGAARGIGRACAEALAGAGAAVVIADRLVDAAEATVEAIRRAGGKAAAIEADVAATERIRDLVARAGNAFGALDILVNNAGISPEAPTESITEEQWDRVMNVNLKAVFFVTQAALPDLTRRPGGAVVNVSSIVARSGGVNSTLDYTASKAGVMGITKALARQYGPQGLRVNAVTPGPVMTDMIQHWPKQKLDDLIGRIPLRRLGTKEDVAHSVVFLASPWAAYLTGVAIDVAGGIYMA